jgi:signal transduction histidine kinase
MRIDPLRLERAFANLLGNALKFTPPGGRIEVRAECEAGSGDRAGRPWLRVDIIDSGRGIPEDLLPHVFEPYYQTSEADRSHGVGLGLAIVKRIVAAHGGRVDVQSREGEGTVFTLWLPVE